MAQLEHMNVTMNTIQAKLKTLTYAQTNQATPKRKHYCWICVSNYTHRSKTCSSKKAVHQDDAYYKKRMDGIEKGREWWLGAIVDKIEISNPKNSLINYIDDPPNPNSNNILEITESGANIHITKQATHIMASVVMENDTKERLTDGRTMDSTHIATLHIPGLSKQARQIHIIPKIQTAPLISLGVLCDDGCNITSDKQEMSIRKNGG